MTAAARRLALSWKHAVKRRAVERRTGVLLRSMADAIIARLTEDR